MVRESILTAIDIGFTSVTVAVVRVGADQAQVLGTGHVICQNGLQRGMVTSIEEVVNAVVAAVGQAEEAADIRVKNVRLGIRGLHVECFTHHGSVAITRSDREITPDDISAVLESARAVHLGMDKQIIGVIPLEFMVDETSEISNPNGMVGSTLGVDVFITTASSTVVENVVRAVKHAGFDVVDISPSLLGTCEAVVTPEEKELGCVAADLGGDAIDVAVYGEKKLFHVEEIPAGLDLIVWDTAHALGCSISHAREIIKNYGWAGPDYAPDNQTIVVTGLDGRAQKRISTEQLASIVQPRVEEILEAIKEVVTRTGRENLVAAGIVLTGGGALLGGLDRVATNMLGWPARLGVPLQSRIICEMEDSPVFSAAIGLTLEKQAFSFRRGPGSRGGGILKGIRKIFEEF